MAKIAIRKAKVADVEEMTDIALDAFRDTELSIRSMPVSDPASRRHWVGSIKDSLLNEAAHVIVAEYVDQPADGDEAQDSFRTDTETKMLGWARWMHRTDYTPPAEPLVFTASQFPPTGDGEFAARFYQANYNATNRIMADHKEWWFLAILVVKEAHQRQGIGSALMKYGVERADRDGVAAYLNSTPEGTRLYEKFEYKLVDVSREEGFNSFHMMRDCTLNT